MIKCPNVITENENYATVTGQLPASRAINARLDYRVYRPHSSEIIFLKNANLTIGPLIIERH